MFRIFFKEAVDWTVPNLNKFIINLELFVWIAWTCKYELFNYMLPMPKNKQTKVSMQVFLELSEEFSGK